MKEERIREDSLPGSVVSPMVSSLEGEAGGVTVAPPSFLLIILLYSSNSSLLTQSNGF